ncbi:toxin-antitoxin system YwqK family antitoxin [Providencia stuartii]|uniref:toxin-antitoxin system YwqK family antitoxin n=1 Tax=Providencia stuartii TaxID=588 RepID=UPI0018C6F69F|nr:hypothetical protein [Providencia stuartii]MBG5918142.1 hypothetical protein [Providencia stuartii]
MLKLNLLKPTLSFSFALLISGCQLFTPTSSQSDLNALNELKGYEFPSTQVPKGTPNGPYEFHYDNGQLESKSWVKNGCLDRYLEYFYENGKTKMYTPIQNCQVNGLVKIYHEDGRKDLEMTASNGKLTGPFKVYHDTKSNKLQASGVFKNGEPQGTISEFDENGQLIQKFNVINGKIVTAQ